VPSGAYLTLGIFIAVWSSDTGALLGGRAIGGPKLIPRVSPNKTWAGFCAGTLVAGVAEAVFFAILGRSAAVGLFAGLLIALIGHAGDLFESWVKRRFRAKDSGGLIPGHGGILDRIDSLLFVAPACALLIVFSSFNPL
jgi:phosphatidate cytidylyltransferase